MLAKILSVFIDESGDFGPYEPHAPYYLVSMILHNQNTDITENIKAFDSHLVNIGYEHHAIHTGPLIRRESVYSNDLVEERKRVPQGAHTKKALQRYAERAILLFIHLLYSQTI